MGTSRQSHNQEDQMTHHDDDRPIEDDRRIDDPNAENRDDDLA